MLHLGLLQSLKYSHMSQIYSGLPRCHDSLSTKNEILQIGEASSLIFYLIYIVCQIPMVEMFATNMSHKLPFYCVNTSYPMDNSLSGRRGPARQTSEKDVLCLHRLGRPSTVHSPDGVSYFLPV